MTTDSLRASFLGTQALCLCLALSLSVPSCTRLIEFAVSNESGGRLEGVNIVIHQVDEMTLGILKPSHNKGVITDSKVPSSCEVTITFKADPDGPEIERKLTVDGGFLTDKRGAMFVIGPPPRYEITTRPISENR